MRRHRHDTECDGNREHADDDRQRGGDERAEREHQHGERERQDALLAAARVLRADRPHVVVERRAPRDFDVEAIGMRQACERIGDGFAQVWHHRMTDVARAGRRQRRDEKRRVPIAADEGRFADRTHGHDLADVRLVRKRRGNRVDDGSKARIRIAHRTVHDDGDIFGDRIGKGLADALRGASGFALLDGRAANGQDALHVSRFGDEQQRENRPRRDDPAAPAYERSRR